MKARTSCFAAAAAIGLLTITSAPVQAGVHTWDVNEIFSNADGTIQFIELQEAAGTAGETGVGGVNLTSSTETYDIPNNVAGPTVYRCLLFATPAYAALPGAVTPDFIFDAGTQVPFFTTSGSTIGFLPYDSRTFGAGQLPTDGVHSINKLIQVQVASPTNYAGTNPPAIPNTMTARRLNEAGTSVLVAWDRSACCARGNFQILYGDKSQLPTSPGGTFSLTGSVCGISPLPPAVVNNFTWNAVPEAADGSGLLWWVMVATNSPASIEGSWGDSTGAIERIGPGVGGSSGQCGITTRDLSNPCGH